MSWFDWIWVAWIAAFGVVEGIGLIGDGRRGVEPLTWLIRDRWMRRSRWVWAGFFAFWVWLGGHFFLGWGP